MTELRRPRPPSGRGSFTRISHWIGGKTVAGTSSRTRPVYNPALGRQWGETPRGLEEIGAAVAAATATFPPEHGAGVQLAKRAELMFNIRELLHERREEVARINSGPARRGALGCDGRGQRADSRRSRARAGSRIPQGRMFEEVATGDRRARIRQPPGWSPGSRRSNSPRWCHVVPRAGASRAATRSS